MNSILDIYDSNQLHLLQPVAQSFDQFTQRDCICIDCDCGFYVVVVVDVDVYVFSTTKKSFNANILYRTDTFGWPMPSLFFNIASTDSGLQLVYCAEASLSLQPISHDTPHQNPSSNLMCPNRMDSHNSKPIPPVHLTYLLAFSNSSCLPCEYLSLSSHNLLLTTTENLN